MLVDHGACLGVQFRDFEPFGRAAIGHPTAAAARPGDDADPLAHRQPVAPVGKPHGDVDQFLDVVRLDDAVFLEHCFIRRVGPRQRARMRGRGAHSGGRAADLRQDNRFARPQRLLRDDRQHRGVLDVFHEQREDIRPALVQHVVDEVQPRQARFIAGGDDVAEGDFLRPAAVEEGIADAAALPGHADEARCAVVRDQRRVGVVHRRAEGRRKRQQRVGKPFRIRADDRHVVALGDILQQFLLRRPGFARFLGKPRAYDQRRLDAGSAAFLERVGHVGGGNDEHRQIDLFGGVADRLVGLEPQHFVMAAADRINRAGEGARRENLDDPSPDDGCIRRRAEDGDRFGPK